jgi:hypothetical protein
MTLYEDQVVCERVAILEVLEEKTGLVRLIADYQIRGGD